MVRIMGNTNTAERYHSYHTPRPPAPHLSVVESPHSPARITPTTRGITDAGTTPHSLAQVAQHLRPDTSTVTPATDTRWSGTRSVSGNSTTSTTAENVRSLEEYFARQRTRSADLPDPEPVVRYLAHCAVEVLLGARDLDQLARWVTGQVYQQLHTRVALATRARAAKGISPRRPTLNLGTVMVSSPSDGIIEATVIVHQHHGRVRAVAIRLEGFDCRWRASAVCVM